MLAGLMRKIFLSSLRLPPRHAFSINRRSGTLRSASLPIVLVRRLAYVRDDDDSKRGLFFTASPPKPQVLLSKSVPNGDQPPNERTLKLGKTVQILHDRLPTLLAQPLPQDILSPQISLVLFPSTHPHLPTVSGRIAYLAALWTAPVAWGRVPVVGNVQLTILSERMIKSPSSSQTSEQLIVRWRTCGKTKGRGVGALYRGIGGGGDQVDKITEFLGGDARDDEEFTGLFIFDFDDKGRILKHTIEHAQEGGNCEKMTRVVSVTDWLIGKAKGSRTSDEGGFALGYSEGENPRKHHSTQ